MPRIGTHKLGTSPTIGRNKLFKILRANHMLIHSKKNYHVTTNFKHWLKKHKTLLMI